MTELSKRQRAILVAMHRHRECRGYWPSIEEIRRATGTSSTSLVAYHLARLDRAGLVERGPSEVARSTKPNYHRLAFVTIGGRCEPWFIRRAGCGWGGGE